MHTKVYGKTVKRILINEEGRGCQTEVRESGKLKRENRRVTRKVCKRLKEKFEVGGFYGATRFVGTSARRECWKTETLPEEDGDVIRECKAMH